MEAGEVYKLMERIDVKIDSKFQILADNIEALRDTINLKLVRKEDIKNLITANDVYNSVTAMGVIKKDDIKDFVLRKELYSALVILFLIFLLLIFFADKAGILDLTPLL